MRRRLRVGEMDGGRSDSGVCCGCAILSDCVCSHRAKLYDNKLTQYSN